MKFDVVVGNPPWNEGGTGKNNTFYHKFYQACLPLAKHYFAFVSPVGFLFSRKNALRKLRSMLYTSGIESIQLLDSQKTFGVTSDWCGIVSVNPNKKTTSFILTYIDGTKREISTENPDIELHTKSLDITDVLNKIKKQCTHTLHPKRGRQKQITKQGIPQTADVSPTKNEEYRYPVVNRLREGVPQFIYARNIIDDDVNHIRIVYNIVSRIGGIGKSYVAVPTEQLTQVVCYITVNSIDEARSLQSYLNSKLFSALVATHKAGVNNSLGVIRQLPRPDNKTKNWTDTELYTHFNLTDEEIKLIEDTIK